MGIERLNEFWPEWRIGEVLGEGSFGRVYKAEKNEMGFSDFSAIKQISIPATRAEYDALRSEGMSVSDTKEYFHDIVNDFINEIRLMTTLKGASNIVAVEDYKLIEKVDEIGYDIFIRMELLTSFKDYLDTHTPSEDEVVKMGIDIASALEICQQRHIIHRDIKPANIFLDDFGSFKLGDFGIAKELEKTSGAASSKGTFSFMAPEVARGLRYDSTVDIYSLGLVMYTLLNGNRPPFVPDNGRITYTDRKEANDRRLAGEPLPVPCNASPILADIILTACSYDPKKRFQSASAFKNALQGYKTGVKATVGTAKPAEKKPDIDETVAVVRKSEPKAQIDRTVAVPHKPEPAKLVTEEIEVPKKKGKAGIIAVVLLLIVALIVILVVQGLNKNNKTGSEIVTFGHYEQDNNSSNGKEEIEWIVLARDGDKALVTSKYALDCQPYNEECVDITWENCTLREWLNDEFYNTAFSEEEKAQIETSYIVNDDNADYGTEGGDDTYDKVFLLSIDEAESYFSSDEAMCCKPTEYAVAQGDYENESYDGNCWWWLRSPGYNTYDAANVNTYGGVDYIGYFVYSSFSAVRPALWINLES